MSYDILIRKKYSEDRLKKAVADFLNISVNSIGNIYDLGLGGEVNIDVDYLDGDFATRLSVYKRDDLMAELKEIDFAIYISEILKETVLITYWTDNPFFWIRIHFNGEIYKVKEVPSEREKFIQINKLFKEKLEKENVISKLK